MQILEIIRGNSLFYGDETLATALEINKKYFKIGDE